MVSAAGYGLRSSRSRHGAALLTLVLLGQAHGVWSQDVLRLITWPFKEHVPEPITPRPLPSEEFYVLVHNGNFVQSAPSQHSKSSCKPFYPVGTNKYEFIEAGAGAPVLFDGRLVEPGLTAQAAVRRVLDGAQQSGINLLRFNAFAVDSRYSVLSKDPASGDLVASEAILRGLDYILDEARQRGLKVLLVLTDYFAEEAGGPLQYMQFAGVNTASLSSEQKALVKAQFYTNAQAQSYYRNYVRMIINRTNTINGRPLKTDPTILGFDVMNEPRCEDNVNPGICDGALTISRWVAGAAAFVHSLDTLHAVTVGLDGFYTTGAGLSVNPIPSYVKLNSDFLLVSSLPQIDFASFNIYPDLWSQMNAGWVRRWIAQHAADGQALGKPVLIKEMGLQPSPARDPLFAVMYAEALEAIASSRTQPGGLRGANFFQAWAKGTEAAPYTQDRRGRFGLQPGDRTLEFVKSFAASIRSLEAEAATNGCPNNLLVPPVLPVPQCPHGYEGPNCDVNINECVRGTHGCDVNAACVVIDGGYSCHCFTGYDGDGRAGNCIPNPTVLAEIHSSYYTNFGGNMWLQFLCPLSRPLARLGL